MIDGILVPALIAKTSCEGQGESPDGLDARRKWAIFDAVDEYDGDSIEQMYRNVYDLAHVRRSARGLGSPRVAALPVKAAILLSRRPVRYPPESPDTRQGNVARRAAHGGWMLDSCLHAVAMPSAGRA